MIYINVTGTLFFLVTHVYTSCLYRNKSLKNNDEQWLPFLL